MRTAGVIRAVDRYGADRPARGVQDAAKLGCEAEASDRGFAAAAQMHERPDRRIWRRLQKTGVARWGTRRRAEKEKLTVGAIGVSGVTSAQDEQIAAAALAALST